MTLIDRIDQIMSERGLKQGELERLADLPANRIAKWKMGTGEPTARQALRIARQLRVPLEWLIDEHSGDQPPAVAGLTDDEAATLDLIRESGLSRRELTRVILEAVRSQGAVLPHPGAAPGRRQGMPESEPEPARGRKRG